MRDAAPSVDRSAVVFARTGKPPPAAGPAPAPVDEGMTHDVPPLLGLTTTDKLEADPLRRWWYGRRDGPYHVTRPDSVERVPGRINVSPGEQGWCDPLPRFVIRHRQPS
ncbi:hypothetical protein GCM10027290_00610 [Micromonospora sonneratiae]